MGHVFRSFYLIKQLKLRNDIIIFTKENSECEYFFKKKNLRVIVYKKTNEFKIFKKKLKDLKITKFVNDSIYLNKNIRDHLIKTKYKSYFLDTKKITPSQNFHCINTFLGSRKNHKNYYSGLEFIIKDPNLKFKIIKFKPNDKIKIVFHFGGTDEKKLNLKILKILSSHTNIKSISIILGPALTYKKNEIKKIINEIKIPCVLFDYPKNLSKIYNTAHMGIISGGNTLFNFCSGGKINISISTNEYEKNNCLKMEKLKLTNYYGHYNNLKKNKFLSLLKKIHNKADNKKKLFKADGIKKITNIINN